MMNRETNEKLINFDFQGWPIYKMNIRDLIQGLGGKLIDGNWVIPESEKLDIFPTIFEDDGMGYGTNKEYLYEINYSPSENYCTLFREKELDNIDLYKEDELELF